VPKSIDEPAALEVLVPVMLIAPEVVKVPLAPEAQVIFEPPVLVAAGILIETAVMLPVPVIVTVWATVFELAVKLKAPVPPELVVIVRVTPVLTLMPLATEGLAIAIEPTETLPAIVKVTPELIVNASAAPGLLPVPVPLAAEPVQEVKVAVSEPLPQVPET